MELRRGVIVDFRGSWGSGLAGLVIEEEDKQVTVYADSGPLGRALQSLYGAACPGNTIDVSKIEGKEILFSTDDLGLLVGFAPADVDDDDFIH